MKQKQTPKDTRFEMKKFREVVRGFIFLKDDAMRNIYYVRRAALDKKCVDICLVFDDGTISKIASSISVSCDDMVGYMRANSIGIFEFQWVSPVSY
jgi:hypothetical protein